jgi:transketolase
MLRLAEVIANELALIAERDPRIWLVDGDLGDSYGVHKIAGRLGDRYVQAGIAEQTMVSLAAGLAAAGAQPWVFSFASFLCCRAYDQIRVCVSQTRLPVVLVGSHAGGCAGPNGKTHALMNDVSLLANLPDIDVWAPTDPTETRTMVAQIVAGRRAAYIRVPRDGHPPLPSPVVDVAGCTRFGDPAAVAIVASGAGTQWALRVQSVLASRGLAVPVAHVARLQPFPVDSVAAAIASADHLVTIEDHYEVGGLADIVRRELPRRTVRALGWPRGWPGASGAADALRAAMGLGDEALADACASELALAQRRSR